jgi:hypothetical protein
MYLNKWASLTELSCQLMQLIQSELVTRAFSDWSLCTYFSLFCQNPSVLLLDNPFSFPLGLQSLIPLLFGSYPVEFRLDASKKWTWPRWGRYALDVGGRPLSSLVNSTHPLGNFGWYLFQLGWYWHQPVWYLYEIS